MFKFIVATLFAVAAAVDPNFLCNDFNGDCNGCMTATPHGAYSCSFCPVDGVCHTIGSLFNKCTDDECMSQSVASSCKQKTTDACAAPSWTGMGKPAPAKASKYVPWDRYVRTKSGGSTCTGPHEFCCEAPSDDPSNCPDSARTSDCDRIGSCCCA